MVCLSCGDFEERQEVISKIRGLGMLSSPLVVTPSPDASALKTVDLKIYVASPKNEPIAFDKYTDEPSAAAYLLESSQYTIVSGTQITESHNAMDITSVTVRSQIPTADKLSLRGGKVRVGILAKGNLSEEKIIVDFLVLPDGVDTTVIQKPTVDILNPSIGTVLNANETFNVIAVSGLNNEDVKVSWFVSDGEITNRRSLNTYWKLPSAGSHTLIVTVRGKKSLSMGIKILDVTIQ
jgi:hypothetical protein